MLKLLANVISDLLDTWMCLKCLSICWYCRTILSIHLVFRPPASDLRHVLMDLPDMDQLKQRLLPGCTTASKNRWQILDHDRSRRKLYFSPHERRLCVPGRRFGIYRFRIFIFPAVFSHPFIEEQLASFCPISPNALRSPLHCNALQCNAPSTVMLWTAQFENGIYNNTVCNLCLH